MLKNAPKGYCLCLATHPEGFLITAGHFPSAGLPVVVLTAVTHPAGFLFTAGHFPSAGLPLVGLTATTHPAGFFFTVNHTLQSHQ